MHLPKEILNVQRFTPQNFYQISIRIAESYFK